MSDRYVHLFPFAAGWDERQANLVTLGRHLVGNARAIEAAGGLAFGYEDMTGLQPLPELVVAAGTTGLPPLAYGPHAGLAPLPGEDWPAYVQRVFGIHEHRPFMGWLQAAMWGKTEPSPEGAALRIAYVLDYGVPHDHVEIAMGQAHTDYDSNGFLWEKLGTYPEVDPDHEERGSAPPKRKWPAWIGAVEHTRRRGAVRADYRVPAGEAPFAAGWGVDNIVALKQRRGPLANVFSDFLLLSGSRDDGNGPYGERLDEIDRLARARVFDAERPEDDPVPREAIFIDLADGRHPEFILGGKRPDSPVFRFDADTGKVTQIGISVFVWIEAFMRRVEEHAAGASAAAAVSAQPPAEGAGDPSLLGRIRRWLSGR